MNTDEIREEMRKHYFLDGQFDPALESYPVCRLFEALAEIDRLWELRNGGGSLGISLQPC